MFGWIFGKKEVEEVRKETKKGFDSVKHDINSIGEWVKHLDSERNYQQDEINEIKNILSSINEEIEGMKNVVSILGEVKSGRNFSSNKQLSKQQTAVCAVQTGVQTGVQTPNLGQFSVTERAIIWILLNTDMKLSYDDLGSILGKERSTIRGQINSIRQKSDLIEEIIEKNGKKRVFIPENMRETILKKSKVRVGKRQKPAKKVKKGIKVKRKST